MGRSQPSLINPSPTKILQKRRARVLQNSGNKSPMKCIIIPSSNPKTLIISSMNSWHDNKLPFFRLEEVCTNRHISWANPRALWTPHLGGKVPVAPWELHWFPNSGDTQTRANKANFKVFCSAFCFFFKLGSALLKDFLNHLEFNFSKPRLKGRITICHSWLIRNSVLHLTHFLLKNNPWVTKLSGIFSTKIWAMLIPQELLTPFTSKLTHEQALDAGLYNVTTSFLLPMPTAVASFFFISLASCEAHEISTWFR